MVECVLSSEGKCNLLPGTLSLSFFYAQNRDRKNTLDVSPCSAVLLLIYQTSTNQHGLTFPFLHTNY